MRKPRGSNGRPASCVAKYQSQTFVDGRIAPALKALTERLLEVQGAALAHDRKRFAAELAKLELRLDALTHEASKRRTIEAATERREQDRGEIVDMVVPLERRRHG